jgi:hypothetical protein
VKGQTGLCHDLRILAGGQWAVAQTMHRRDDMIAMHRGFRATLSDRLLHHLHGIFGQQLQNPNVLARPGREALAPLQVLSQLLKAGRQFPAGKHKGVVQGRRPTPQNRQIMAGLHDPFASGIMAFVTGNDHLAGHHVDPIHIRLDGHGLKGPATRNTVAIRVESHRLVLVHLRRFRHKRIKGMGR